MPASLTEERWLIFQGQILLTFPHLRSPRTVYNLPLEHLSHLFVELSVPFIDDEGRYHGEFTFPFPGRSKHN